jgi:hypothetical protein
MTNPALCGVFRADGSWLLFGAVIILAPSTVVRRNLSTTVPIVADKLFHYRLWTNQAV